MSNIVTTSGRSINTVTAEIVAISNQAAQMAYMSMIEIGKRLVEAKALVDHGEWGSYLKNEVKFSQRTANNFMQIYERSQSGANSQALANLSYTQIVRLLALPDEELSEFTETHDVKNMSTRQLEQAIRERDEARKALAEIQSDADAAKAAARDAEQRLLDMQNKAAAAKSSESAWKEEIDKLNAALNKATAAAENAKKQLNDLKENPKIPDAVREQLLAEASAKASDKIRAELQGQLDAAQQQAQAAAQERDAAEKAAQEAKAQLSNFRKTAQLTKPDVMAFNLLGKQILEEFNRMLGYRMKVGASDPDMDAKMKEYMLKLADTLRAKAEGKRGKSSVVDQEGGNQDAKMQ